MDGYFYGEATFGIYAMNYFDNPSPKAPFAGGGDAVATWHWKDETIADGETKTYRVKLGIGGEGSEAVANTPAVTFNPNNGKPASVVYVADIATGMTDPTWGNYTLEGWYTEKELTNKVDPATLTTSTTLYAKWTKNGKEVVTKPIVIDDTTATVDSATEGWKWDATSKTLTYNTCNNHKHTYHHSRCRCSYRSRHNLHRSILCKCKSTATNTPKRQQR